MLIMNADRSGVGPSVSSVYQVESCARSCAEICGMISGSGGPLSISNSLETVMRPSRTGFIALPPLQSRLGRQLRGKHGPRLDGSGFNQEETQHAADGSGGRHHEDGGGKLREVGNFAGERHEPR